MNAVENKIPNVTDLFKKNRLWCKNINIEAKYLAISDLNKLIVEIRDTKLKQRQLVNKSAVAGFIDKVDLNKKLVTLAIKTELKNKLEDIIKL